MARFAFARPGFAGSPAGTRRRSLRWLAAPLALAAMLAGCAHLPPRETHPPRPRAGYERLVDELGPADASQLAGKRIAIDPGHGGVFRGALGPHGLTEAEVNLGVALDLKRLLAERGATVFLTRETDRDFLSPADSSLHADLTERTRLANEFHPDLFLSIHHNADARGAHDVNETQTYYKLGDDGPSLDAASDVHRSLVRNLGIEKHRILPGNYFVLRTSEAPALLTESSYLTNPDVEAKLASPEKRELEAEALTLGLSRYFMRHAPQVDSLWVFPPADARNDVVATLTPAIVARVRGAFDRVRLTLDGSEVVPVVFGDSIAYTPLEPLTVGPHDVALAARLAGAGASRSRTLRFRVGSSHGKIVAQFPDQRMWTGDQPLGLRVRVLDDAGHVYRDSVRVRVRDLGTIRVSPADTELVFPRGEGWVYFRARSWPALRPRHRVPELKIRVEQWPTRRGEFGSPLEEPAIVTLATWLPRGYMNPIRTGFAIGMPGDTVLRAAPGTVGDEPRLSWINADGFVRLPRDSSGAVLLPNLAGYRRWPTEHAAILAPRDSSEAQDFVPVPAAAPAWPPRFVAICGGVLHGRRIVIDPAGGGDDAAGEGASGTRAAALNLEVARALAGFLSAAGAEVKLTREGDFALSDVERVQIGEAFHPERFLRIGHAPEPAMIGYYFSSVPGRAWAARTRTAFETLGLPAPPPAEDAQYAIQQTSCPALYASPARIDVPATETRLLAPGTLRSEAYALFIALASEWAPAAAWPVDSIEVRDDSGRPAAGVPVTLGEALVLETDALGRARFERTEPGPIEAEIRGSGFGGRIVRRVLLEFERGVVLTTGSTGR